MKIYCLCGHENHEEMPFEDHSGLRIPCTSACRRAREDRIAAGQAAKLPDNVFLLPPQPPSIQPGARFTTRPM